MLRGTRHFCRKHRARKYFRRIFKNLVSKSEKSVEYKVRAKIFEKLLHFGSENRKNAGYLYEGINL